MELDGKIYRRYTRELINSDITVYDLFRWKKVNVRLTSYSTGKVLTDMQDLEFPEGYSQSACDIIASKYFRKKGVPGPRGCEYSMRQVAHRMVSFWVDALYDEVMITEDQKQIVYDELAYMFLAQMWAPNSPQWFNTGLKLAYGIAGNAQGNYYYDEDKADAVASQDAYTRTTGSACFIIGVKDSLMGEKSLTDGLTTETLIFKFGGGAGTNWSPIRGRNENLSGGGKSSGLMSFLKVFDRNAGAIKSGGTTRRAAKMNILNLDHPEIMDYIMWKSREEDKVVALGKMGYDTGMEGEAYETVSGQNANNSVRVPDSFMAKLDEPGAVWRTKGRIDPTSDGEIPVSELWNAVNYAAWRCGDPGIQFDGTINAWHTCPAGEDGVLGADHNRINASNPCSEYMFLDDTSCNLASINVLKFYDTESDSFDIDGYLHAVKLVQMILEATNYWGQFPTKDIARKTYMFRTTGIGLCNLGTLFMHMAVPYDSEEARTTAAGLCSLMTGYSYYISALMAEKAGPFPCYPKNAASMKKVIRNHARAANYSVRDTVFEDMPYEPVKIDHSLLCGMGFSDMSESLKETWADAIAAGEKYGYRNAQVSVLAPTGTIAFAMDAETPSSEPFFGHVLYKKLVGGGFMTLVSSAIPTALKKLGYSDEQAKEIAGYVVRQDEFGGILDGKIEGAPHLRKEHYAVFDTAGKCGTGERYISPEGHVRMMAAMAPHITGAISKTVNLPAEATVEDVDGIYRMSWRMGVKAIALFRDGCKATQPLNTAKEGARERGFEEYSYQELIDYINTKKTVYKPMRVKPAGIRSAHLHEASINGLRLYITTSFYEDGRLAELFISSGREGSLIKGLLESLSKAISEMLQYGVPPQNVSKMHRGQSFEPNGIVTGHPYIKFVDSISDMISKIIDIEMGDFTYCQVKPDGYTPSAADANREAAQSKHYTVNDYLQGEVCPYCQSPKMVKNGSCKVCTECGSTTGCS